MRSSSSETFQPPTDADFMVAWSAVRGLELLHRPDGAARLARVVYAAERARKLLAGTPTCAERIQE